MKDENPDKPPREWKSVEYLREQESYNRWKNQQSTIRITLSSCTFGFFVAYFHPLLGAVMIGSSIALYFLFERRKR